MRAYRLWFLVPFVFSLESDMKENKKVKQLEFEESFESTEDLIHETCIICGKVTVEESTVDYCEEISCPYEQIGETHSIPGYSELMFDDDGNYIKNFLGKEK